MIKLIVMPIKIRIRPPNEPPLRTPRDFSDQLAASSLCPTAEDAGRQAKAVRTRIARSTAGWPVRPTVDEFYEAIRAPSPSDRQTAIVAMWAQEAEPREMLRACPGCVRLDLSPIPGQAASLARSGSMKTGCYVKLGTQITVKIA